MTIEIFDKVRTKAGALVLVNLLDILDVLTPEATNLQWSVLDLEATTSADSGISMLQLEEEVSTSGKHLTYLELRDLASKLSQVTNGVFVGCYGRTCSPRSLLDDDLRKDCDVAIIAHDSSVWIVHVKELDVIDRLKDRFQDTRMIGCE